MSGGQHSRVLENKVKNLKNRFAAAWKETKFEQAKWDFMLHLHPVLVSKGNLFQGSIYSFLSVTMTTEEYITT